MCDISQCGLARDVSGSRGLTPNAMTRVSLVQWLDYRVQVHWSFATDVDKVGEFITVYKWDAIALTLAAAVQARGMNLSGRPCQWPWSRRRR